MSSTIEAVYDIRGATCNFFPKSIPSSSKVKGRRYNCVEVKVSIMWAWDLGKQQNPLDTFRIQSFFCF